MAHKRKSKKSSRSQRHLKNREKIYSRSQRHLRPWRRRARSNVQVCAPGGGMRRGCPDVRWECFNKMGRHILRFFEECQRQNIGDKRNPPWHRLPTWLLGAYCPSWCVQARVAETMLRWESITPFGFPSRVSPKAASLCDKRLKMRSSRGETLRSRWLRWCLEEAEPPPACAEPRTSPPPRTWGCASFTFQLRHRSPPDWPDHLDPERVCLLDKARLHVPHSHDHF